MLLLNIKGVDDFPFLDDPLVTLSALAPHELCVPGKRTMAGNRLPLSGQGGVAGS